MSTERPQPLHDKEDDCKPRASAARSRGTPPWVRLAPRLGATHITTKDSTSDMASGNALSGLPLEENHHLSVSDALDKVFGPAAVGPAAVGPSQRDLWQVWEVPDREIAQLTALFALELGLPETTGAEIEAYVNRYANIM